MVGRNASLHARHSNPGERSRSAVPQWGQCGCVSAWATSYTRATLLVRPEKGRRLSTEPPASTAITKNRRYEGYYDALNDRRMAEAAARPCTLPAQAYGPEPIQWVPVGQSKPPVWVWVQWPHRPAERIGAFAAGWNDRVVVVEWTGPGGTRNTVVWRNAVTRRVRS